MDLVDRGRALPRERLPQLEDPHQVLRQRGVPQKQVRMPASRAAASTFAHLRGDLCSVLKLPHDPDLHVVHDQRGAVRVQRFSQCFGNVEAVGSLSWGTTGFSGPGPPATAG